MPDFPNPDQMMSAIQSKVHGALHSLQPAYEEVGELFKHESQERIGHYQGAEGPFEAWAQLAKETQEQRERLGYSPNDPLLRRGLVRDSIEVAATEESVVVGVPDKEVQTEDGKSVNIGVIAEVLEKGNEHIPPRSFLGGAFFHERDKAVIIINEAIGRRLRE